MERQRQTVPIAGINRAENDLTVQDGCCETLHNLRYDAGAWRNVETFRPVAEITDFGGFTLLYKHPATADDLYIASDESGTIHEVCVSGGRLSSTQVIMRGVSELRQTFSFGNVLVFITDGRELYYVLYRLKKPSDTHPATYAGPTFLHVVGVLSSKRFYVRVLPCARGVKTPCRA